MKLSASNIGWPEEYDREVYKMMKKYKFTGLEIAPTRIFPEHPYDKLEEANIWSHKIIKENGFTVPSMQSIWYGCSEKLFGTGNERESLFEYTKKAIDFAAMIQCKNLVFGCPLNRDMPKGADVSVAVDFFKGIGDYAKKRGTIIGMEANPPMYHTNYINDTPSALKLIEQVGSEGFLLNLDVGTMIQNQEALSELVGKSHLINHVHISEPGLKPIKKRSFHQELAKWLRKEKYSGFVSVEIGKTDDLSILEKCFRYVCYVFYED